MRLRKLKRVHVLHCDDVPLRLQFVCDEAIGDENDERRKEKEEDCLQYYIYSSIQDSMLVYLEGNEELVDSLPLGVDVTFTWRNALNMRSLGDFNHYRSYRYLR